MFPFILDYFSRPVLGTGIQNQEGHHSGRDSALSLQVDSAVLAISLSVCFASLKRIPEKAEEQVVLVTLSSTCKGNGMGPGTDPPKRVKLRGKTSPDLMGMPPGFPLPKKPTVSPHHP